MPTTLPSRQYIRNINSISTQCPPPYPLDSTYIILIVSLPNAHHLTLSTVHTIYQWYVFPMPTTLPSRQYIHNINSISSQCPPPYPRDSTYNISMVSLPNAHHLTLSTVHTTYQWYLFSMSTTLPSRQYI